MKRSGFATRHLMRLAHRNCIIRQQRSVSRAVCGAAYAAPVARQKPRLQGLRQIAIVTWPDKCTTRVHLRLLSRQGHSGLKCPFVAPLAAMRGSSDA